MSCVCALSDLGRCGSGSPEALGKALNAQIPALVPSLPGSPTSAALSSGAEGPLGSRLGCSVQTGWPWVFPLPVPHPVHLLLTLAAAAGLGERPELTEEKRMEVRALGRGREQGPQQG